MIVSIQPPPQDLLDRIRAAGMKPDLSCTVFTVGNVLYNPGGNPISLDLMAHEVIHSKQQSIMGIDAWWDRYLVDIPFRVEQELEAYRAQFRFYRDRHRNIRKQTEFLARIAADLGGPLYGGVMTVGEAAAAILEP